MNARSRLGRVSVFLFAFAVALPFVAQVPTAAAADVGPWSFDDPCPDVLVIGARGSGQEADASGGFTTETPTKGLGPEVYGYYEGIAEGLDAYGLSVGFYANPYPAVTLQDWIDGDPDLYESVESGRDVTRVMVAGVSAACGTSTSIVLIGYSQGAMVAQDGAGFVRTEDEDLIAAVILISDPTFDPTGDGTLVGGMDPAIPGAIPVPIDEYVRDRTLSVCLPGDIVCQGNSLGMLHLVGSWLGGGTAVHTEGYKDFIHLRVYPALASTFIAQQLGLVPSGSGANVDVALVIDSSGSMGSTDPSDLRKSASRVFINAAQDGDYLGVIDFDGSVRTPGPLARIPAGRDGLLTAVDTINSSGNTNIGIGVQEACAMLTASTSGNSKAAVLLTDGSGSYSSQHSCFTENGWPIHTVGLSSGAAVALLEDIAQATGGTFSYLATADQLESLFLRIRGEVTGGDTILDSSNWMFRDDRQTHAASVGVGVASVSFLSTWAGSTVDMTLTSPSGRIITCETVASDVRCDEEPTSELITIENPESGSWGVELFGTDLPPAGEEVTVIAVETPSDAPPATNEAPAVIASVSQQTVQYSDAIPPVAFTASDPDDVPESLAISTEWSLHGGPPTAGLPAAWSLVPGACDAAACGWTLEGTATQTGVVTVSVTATDPGGAAATAMTSVAASVEVASVRYDGGNPMSVAVAEPGGTSQPFDLVVGVRESTPDEPAVYAGPGDISLADVSMQLVPIEDGEPVLPESCDESTASSGYDSELTVSCRFENVPVDAYSVEADVAGDFYAGGGESFLTVFDPSVRFSGGGWTLSEPGSHTVDTSASGKAWFWVSAGYKRGASIPTGSAVFRFRSARLTFRTTSYDWLVATDRESARLAGEGKVNGEAGYRFQIWAGDGYPDAFRIRIWSEQNGTEAVIYDSGPDDGITSGSITIRSPRRPFLNKWYFNAKGR